MTGKTLSDDHEVIKEDGQSTSRFAKGLRYRDLKDIRMLVLDYRLIL